MVPRNSSPELSVAADGSADPELLALPRPPRQERTLSLVLMGMTALLALVMTGALVGDLRYAMRGQEPLDIGDLAGFEAAASPSNVFVRGTGRLSDAGAIRYDRALERDSFRLAPLASNEKIWVEMRIPSAGPEGSGVVGPTTFVGRLLPMQGAFRYRGLARSVKQATGIVVADGAWVLVDGETPSASRWAVALAGLFAIFAMYNVVTIVRILRRVRR
jgi:hypothetical protein